MIVYTNNTKGPLMLYVQEEDKPAVSIELSPRKKVFQCPDDCKVLNSDYLVSRGDLSEERF